MNLNLFKKIFLPVLFLSLSFASEGKIFNTSYVSFEIPENWQCKSFGTDWVCHSTLSEKEKEAMIILTAKISGSLDNFDTYLNFLSQPREGVTKSQQPFQSKVVHAKKIMINNQIWVDGFHQESEIPSYYTRYVVTNCCSNQPQKLAILITYSAHQSHYAKYANDFVKSINSLRVLNVKKGISEIKELGTGENLGSVSSYMENILNGDDMDGDMGGSSSKILGLDSTTFGAVTLMILGAGSYLFIRKRRKKLKMAQQKRR